MTASTDTPHARKTPAGAAALIFLLAASCSSAEPDAGAPKQERSDVPLQREAAMEHFLDGTRKLCSRDGFLELARTSREDCLAYIERARPICDEEAKLALPATFPDAPEARKRGQTYVRCLAPPLAKE